MTGTSWRPLSAVVAAGALGLTALGAVALPSQAAPVTVAASGSTTTGIEDWTVRQQAKVLGFDRRKNSDEGPRGANPYLALVPKPRRADYAGWARELDRLSARRARLRAQRTVIPEPVLVEEQEPGDTWGGNDTIGSAQPVPELGAARPSGVRIEGRLTNQRVRAQRLRPNREDDGAIGKARRTGVGGVRRGFVTTGRIGDGPHGRSGTGHGDFDVYMVRGRVGQTIAVGTATDRLDSMVSIFDENGDMVAFNDDRPTSLASFVRYQVTEPGPYYVFVSGYWNLPRNPFRSGSGDGAGSQGDYRIRITQAAADVDMYGIHLEVGDVLGATTSGGASMIGVLEPDGELVHGSDQDASFIYPMAAPLPGGGRATTDHVADQAGTHYVALSRGDGAYSATVEAYRPGFEDDPPTQVLSLDFDGQRVNTGVFWGWGQSELSPLRGFLGRWGLTNADYEPLVDQIVATVEENIADDLAASGVNPDFDVEVRVSPDDDDPFGDPHVSRVVVGGTIEESGVPTIGIAQSIDPGNFEGEDTALVLLDVLSGDTDEWGDASLNYYLRPSSDRVRFVGTAIGNVVSHEIGHFVGNWHVDQFNDTLNLMDQGGNFPLLYGVGEDGIGGTADDPDVDFGEDVFNPFEGFLGVEDTASRMSTTLTQ